MKARLYIFPHEAPVYLGISRPEFDLLRKYDSFPHAERVDGTCVFFFWKSDIDDFVQSFQTRQAFQGHLDYLNQIFREE